jgi:hypothetical protein
MMVLLAIPSHRREEFAQIFNSQAREDMDSVMRARLARIIWDAMRNG